MTSLRDLSITQVISNNMARIGPDEAANQCIVFSGGWGTPSARNRVIAIPMIAQGYTGRAK
jgi:hypothetical protein